MHDYDFKNCRFRFERSIIYISRIMAQINLHIKWPIFEEGVVYVKK